MLIGNVISLIIVANLVIAYQPDNQVKNADEEAYIGDNIYNFTGENQTATQISPVGHTAIYHVKIENDGSQIDSFIVTGSASNFVCSRKYFDALEDGYDITEQVSDDIDGWSTGPLAPGNYREIRLEMTMLLPVYNYHTTLIRCDTSHNDGYDAVRCSLIVNTSQPDNEIQAPGPGGYCGNNIYNETGERQTVTSYSRAGNTVNYHVAISNDGLEDEPYTITGTPGNGAWTVRYFDSDDTSSSGDLDITDEITSEEGWLTTTLPATCSPSEGVLIEVTSSAGIEPKSSYPVTLTSTSTLNPDTKDVVGAVTIIDFNQPDLHISVNGVQYRGGDIYNKDGTDQTATRLISEGDTVAYHVPLGNDGFREDYFKITGPRAPTGWQVRYLRWDYVQGIYHDLTSAVTGKGMLTQSLPINVPMYVWFLIEVKRVSSEASDSMFIVDFKATSVRDPEFCDVVKAITQLSSRIEEQPLRPNEFFMETSSITSDGVSIKYGLPRAGDVHLFICDVTGRKVKTLISGRMAAGEYKASWRGYDEEGSILPDGIYFCRLEANQYSAVKKIIVKR